MSTLFWRVAPGAGDLASLVAQVTAVALLSLAVSHLVFRRHAAARHAVLVVALVAVAAAPLWRLAARAIERSTPPQAVPRATLFVVPALLRNDQIAQAFEPRRAAVISPLRPVHLVAAVWAAGSLVMLLRLAGGVAVWWRLVRRARATAVPGAGRVLLSDDVAGPVSVGLFRPAIVLPAALVDQLDPSQLRQVLAHEWSHVRRRDHLVAVLQRLVAAAWWPHPLVHLLNRSLDAAREQRCDNDVLAAGHDRLDYARTLLRVAAWMAAHPRPCRALVGAAAAAAGDVMVLGMPRRRLERRVAELVDERRNLMTRAPLPLVCATAAGFVAVAVLASALTGVARADAPVTAPPAATVTITVTAPPSSPAPSPAVAAAAATQPAALPLHEIKFELGEAEFADGDNIKIDQVLCTGERLGIGEIAIVRGTYTLASHNEAEIALFVTARSPQGTPIDPRQRMAIKKGSGTFELRHALWDGYPHVSFYAGNAFGGVYFGRGDSVLRKKGWSYKDENPRGTDRTGGGGEKK